MRDRIVEDGMKELREPVGEVTQAHRAVEHHKVRVCGERPRDAGLPSREDRSHQRQQKR
jgi:hypothetical protein